MAVAHPGAYLRQMKIVPESAVTVSLKPVKSVMMAIPSIPETAVRLNVANNSVCGDGLVQSVFEICDDGFVDACGSCNADCTGAGSTKLWRWFILS